MFICLDLLCIKLVKRGAGFDPAERTVKWTVDPLNLIQVILAEGYVNE